MKKLLIALLVSLTAVAFLATPALAAVEWESYTTTPDSAVAIYGAIWSSQTFTVGSEAHSVTQIKLSLYRVGSPGTVTVSIRATSGGAPNGADLTSGTIDGNALTTSTSGDWYPINVTPYSLSANTTYAIVVRAVAGTSTSVCAMWRMDGSAGTYSGGSEWTSANSGASWTQDTDDDYMFYIYGEHLISVVSSQVFTGYKETGDLLFVTYYTNSYVPYYPLSPCSQYFDIQLRSTNGSTVLASTTCQAWGNKPGAIYLSADSAAPLTQGSAYRIYLYGQFTGNPSTYYSLTSTDWRGSDLTYLDQYLIQVAHNMEDYYGVDFVTYISGKGEVLNEEGGVIFDAGIPSLSVVRPDLFQSVVHTPAYEEPTWTNSFWGATTWETQVGSRAADAMNSLGTLFGLSSGQGIAGIALIAVYIVIAIFLVGGNPLFALGLGFPIILLGSWLRIIDIIGIGVIVAVMALVFVWNVWLSKA